MSTLLTFVADNDILFIWIGILVIAVVSLFIMSKSDRKRNG